MSMCAYMKELNPEALEELRNDPESVEEFVSEASESGGLVDLHKSWQALHFVLTGTPWEVDDRIPVSQAVLGGEEIGDDFTGYGPVRVIGPEAVQKVSNGMGLLQISDLINKYSPEDYEKADLYAFNGIEEEKGSISSCFTQLKTFYAGCASRGSAVLIWIE